MNIALLVLLSAAVVLGNGSILVLALLRLAEERRDVADARRTADIQRQQSMYSGPHLVR
ncbi:hypothetical protein [Frankia sp. Cj5]|uniref:hypothetical protein n=1 Tax=Frankia sp. Cj5 TaxID=2880978 RepID=UPI001EF6AA23|nr:hypothetical protein [Frankia sp. Cj5]